LDIGCGNGRFCPTVINVGADYTGIDIAENLIKIAKKTIPLESLQSRRQTICHSLIKLLTQ